jgi:hypothetical protein
MPPHTCTPLASEGFRSFGRRGGTASPLAMAASLPLNQGQILNEGPRRKFGVSWETGTEIEEQHTKAKAGGGQGAYQSQSLSNGLGGPQRTWG